MKQILVVIAAVDLLGFAVSVSWCTDIPLQTAGQTHAPACPKGGICEPE